MAHTSVYLHLIWSTKERLPQLAPAVRSHIFPIMSGIAQNLRANVIAANGVEDHMHALVRIPPTLTIADLVRDMKSASAREANEKAERMVLKWQTKYAAFSVYPKDIDVVLRYIANQAKHHKKKSFKEEIVETLDDLGIEYDGRYMWE